ncbi:ribonucleases P/MRP protein subunit POP1 [Bufo gargarizans]|uniref:ribonucleases P/MRP protein subunit POP1 n=1 Tax=Bufo gargarizans TaxID=30331 RepID=UPI001CF442B3|nr:ribonucleases P/MRP protein subunit POP1 [Bufo gargarizans]XP_044149461.1 ribonucleases P/MRP protein subunit POP1 [Bufo gargarizans]XP_044149462.1 ribonucleases P/MRP protein subunit POP1 [Bufo gargarizans]
MNKIMSTAKEKKYAKRMRNQPSNVSLDQSDGAPPHHGGRGSFQPYSGASPGSSGQQHRGAHQSHFHSRGGRGRGAPSESQQIPKYVTASMFAQARAAEINAMVKAVSQKSSNSLVFQSLPRHMRRRAMGHNIKRLPRRLREIAKKEMEKTMHQKKEQSKSKCRKARRRHGNLQLEFNRRQRKNIWLETHIWHAKRFHMLKKWGYCLAHRPTMKSYRACYRAMSSHCLLQDLTYYCCVELLGKEEDLLLALSRLCSVDAGPTFMAAPCISGKRQGSLVLYRADKYPGEALGHITFIWKPRSVSGMACDERQLWIWMHPALKEDVLKELRLVCVCEDRPDNFVCIPEPAPPPVKEEPPATATKAGKKRKLQNKEGEKAVPVKKIIGDGTRATPDPYYWTSTQTGITIRDLTMEIVRYRLVGPLSNCVLGDALHVAPLHKESEDSGPHGWWAGYCGNPDNLLRHSNQESLFKLLKGLESPAQIPSGTVLGLTVGDPRLNLPKRRTKSFPNLENYEDRDKVNSLMLAGVPVECSDGLIWSSDVRSRVTDNKISEQEINRLRSELLVPGSKLDLGNNESKIPVLLIQQSGKVTGKDRPGWGSGWDICLPKGWGMAFWIPLIYRGVRVGGLQQGLQHYQYMGAPNVPGEFPDTPAGAQSAQEAKAQLLEKYTRRPPAKRTNFIKHGVLAPFRCPWDQLTREWEMRPSMIDDPETKEKTCESPEEMKMELSSAVSTEETVLEEDHKGRKDFSVLRSKKILKILSALVSPEIRGGKRANDQPPELSNQVTSVLADYPRSLVWVRLSMTKGNPELHSLICIPTEQDLHHLKQDKSFPGPVEPKHGDPFKNKVLKLKKDKKKDKTKKVLEKNDAAGEASCGDDLMLGLWPSPLPELTGHCSRVLLGYVTQGDFSMAMGCGEALGFVSLTGLAHMLSGQPQHQTGLVLIRNLTSLQYRFAKLTIEV